MHTFGLMNSPLLFSAPKESLPDVNGTLTSCVPNNVNTLHFDKSCSNGHRLILECFFL